MFELFMSVLKCLITNTPQKFVSNKIKIKLCGNDLRKIKDFEQHLKNYKNLLEII